jgi:hypothetical protein
MHIRSALVPGACEFIALLVHGESGERMEIGAQGELLPAGSADDKSRDREPEATR